MILQQFFRRNSHGIIEKSPRNALLCLCLVEEIIDEEEFVLLYDTYRPRNLPFPHSAYEKFSLANKDPAKCKADFRVGKRDIP